MPPTTADRYRRWFEYEKDSHAKVAASLAAVPHELRSTGEFRKAVTLLAHLVAARRLWLFRFGIAAEPPAEFFPENLAVEELPSLLAGMESAWSEYLEKLDDDAVAREFRYRSMEGDWYRNTVEDILTQLYGHSLYHRGQIAALLRSIGCEPAATDFVFWTRVSS